MKKYILNIFCLLCCSGSFAQTADDGSVEYHIPVVFHLVHDFGSEYIHDSIFVLSIQRLNDIFNKRNVDTTSIISAYRGLINNSRQHYIGNANISFHMATKDPYGNPSTGVTRHRSYLTNYGSDYIKYEQWPPERYLNIWIVNKMDDEHAFTTLFSVSPSRAVANPYYDGVVSMVHTIRISEFLSPGPAEMLGLKYVFGEGPLLTSICGDDDIDDTPPTKGHDPLGSCSDLKDLYDTACVYTHDVAINKPQIDSVKRLDGSYAVEEDTSTSKSIRFECRTASTLNSFLFYPTAPVGSVYKIGLRRDGVLIDSIRVLSAVKYTAQLVVANLPIPAAPKTSSYELFFMQNPGALRDTLSALSYPKGVEGSVLSQNESTTAYYNFFYDWKVTHGYFRIYAGDSLVDYPDTTNSQNLMDRMYCPKMFTHGQVMKMRETLRSSLGGRDKLVAAENLVATGALDPMPAMKPKAEILVDQAITPSSIRSYERGYFTCQNEASQYNLVFVNKSWRAQAEKVEWILSNDATVPGSAAPDKVSTKFGGTGWAGVMMIASNAQGSDTATEQVYIADTNAINPIGYWQEFNTAADYANWPIFNYYKNQYKWEINDRGYFDNTSIRYKSYDTHSFPENLLGSPQGDYDDFFTPAFDLSKLADNGNLNFMYAGAYTTNDPVLKKDVLEISYSPNCGGTWMALKTMSGEELQTMDPVSDEEYLSHYEDWKPMSIDLKNGPNKIRNSRVFFRFRYKPSAYKKLEGRYAAGNIFYIDRIHISNNPLSVNEMILVDKSAAVSPNPTNSNAFVLFQKPNANVQISVTDVTGKLVYTVNTKVDQINATVEIPAAALGVKGFYMVHITGEDNLNQTEKLVVY
jgi:hypothetical protein